MANTVTWVLALMGYYFILAIVVSCISVSGLSDSTVYLQSYMLDQANASNSSTIAGTGAPVNETVSLLTSYCYSGD
jgi:hypothetical protein